MIDKFEDSKQQWVKTELKDHRSFTEININSNEDWQEYVDIIYTTLRPYVGKYVKDIKIDEVKQWPEKFGFEQIRFKKYEVNNEDEFQEHVMLWTMLVLEDFLVFFLYLKIMRRSYNFPD